MVKLRQRHLCFAGIQYHEGQTQSLQRISDRTSGSIREETNFWKVPADPKQRVWAKKLVQTPLKLRKFLPKSHQLVYNTHQGYQGTPRESATDFVQPSSLRDHNMMRLSWEYKLQQKNFTCHLLPASIWIPNKNMICSSRLTLWDPW